MINAAIVTSNADFLFLLRRHIHTLSLFHVSLVLTDFFCHSLSFLPFSIKLCMSFFCFTTMMTTDNPSSSFWRRCRSAIVSFLLVVLLLSLSSTSLYYSSRRLVTAKSVVVMHPIERQLLNIPVLLFLMRLP
jgi:hypothetical protein